MVIDAQQKQYNKQDIKKEESEGYHHKCGLPMFAIMSRVRIENDQKKKQHEKTLIEISIPDRLTAEAYLQRSL